MQACKCGCGEPVAKGRVFVNKDHQTNWRKAERDRRHKQQAIAPARRAEPEPKYVPPPVAPPAQEDARHLASERAYRLHVWSEFLAEMILHIGGAAGICYLAVTALGRVELPVLPYLPWMIVMVGAWIAGKAILAILDPGAYYYRELHTNMSRHGILPKSTLVYFLSRGIIAATLLYAAFVWPNSI